MGMEGFKFSVDTTPHSSWCSFHDDSGLHSHRTASGSDTLAIFDCRSRIAATGNAVNVTKERLGGTEWGYPNTSVTFCGMANIHKVREFYTRLCESDPGLSQPQLQMVLHTLDFTWP